MLKENYYIATDKGNNKTNLLFLYQNICNGYALEFPKASVQELFLNQQLLINFSFLHESCCKYSLEVPRILIDKREIFTRNPLLSGAVIASAMSREILFVCVEVLRPSQPNGVM